MQYVRSIDELIGSTPLLKIDGFGADIFAKIESKNPAGSVKDRVAKQIIDDAEAAGKLAQGGVIIEPTSGNTGIGLAAIAAVRGYRMILVMPDTMSSERIKLARAYGAEVILTPGSAGMRGAVEKAKELLESTPGAYLPGQFDNPSNPRAHYLGTGPEIWEALDGRIDALVCTVGTGGTLTGTARYLKEKNREVKVIAVEPADSPLLSKGKAGPHKLQGIGANFIPSVLDRSLIDEVLTATTEEAFGAARALAVKFGLLVGISSGAAMSAAEKVAVRSEFAGKNIVVIFPDGGEKYISTDLFA